MAERFHKEIGYGSTTYEEELPLNAETVRLYTFHQFESLWMRNIANNMGAILSGENLLNYKGGRDMPSLVVGWGPSIQRHKQLELLKNHPALESGKFQLIACDAALKPLLAEGIEPDLVVTLDGTPKTAKFFEGVMDLEKAVIAPSITVHPSTAIAANLASSKQLHWFMPMWDDIRGGRVTCPMCNNVVQTPTSYTRTLHYMTEKVILQTLGNVGATSFFTALHVGSNNIGIMGLDYGYPPETPLEETQYYKAYVNMLEGYNAELPELNKKIMEDYEARKEAYTKAKEQFEATWGRSVDPTSDAFPDQPELRKPRKINSCYRYIINEDTQKHILVGLNWDVYRTIFLDFVAHMPNKVPIHNLSPESSIFGPGITTETLESWLEGML